MNHREYSEADDEILIKRFTDSGDRLAFQVLVERHIGSLRKFLFTLFRGCREDMEDAEQEILMSLFMGLKNFKFRSSFKTYFYRLSKNRAIDILRRKKREKIFGFKTDDLREKASETGRPEEELLKNDCRNKIVEALFGLETEEGLSIKTISSILGIPEGTVKSRLHRLRERLADQFQKEGICL